MRVPRIEDRPPGELDEIRLMTAEAIGYSQLAAVFVAFAEARTGCKRSAP
jgi:hypothetical protein